MTADGSRGNAHCGRLHEMPDDGSPNPLSSERAASRGAALV